MKIVLFVEGATEKSVLPRFLKRWLDPKLPKPIGVKVVQFEGWRNYENDIATKAKLNLTGKSGADVVGGFGLLDLYGPTFYPGDKTSAPDRAAWAKDHLEKVVSQPKFRQHFAVHELEAWLLSAPDILPKAVKDALPGKSAQPETVNFNDPPAAMLERLYKEKLKKPYKKTIDGVSLFEALAPETAYQKCPYLKRLLDDILAVATAPERRDA